MPNLRMEIAQRLMEWYAETARPFPWRTQPPDPFIVLLSETMLQQTQASRVATLLPVFLDSYPTIHHLASATNGEIIRHWKGLGYNSRALRLRDAARMIVEHHQGVVPSDVDALRALPGVGPYTSAAIACFAYNVYAVVLDVNVRRVYSRLTRPQPTTVDVEEDSVLVDVARSLIPPEAPSQWHHAVMDLGATICTARSPQCSLCPMANVCPSAGIMQAATRTKRSEPMFRGEARRLWRGRVVEHLRHVGHGGITESALTKAVLGGAVTDDERRWLRELISVLERDGVVSQRGRRISLAD